MPSPSSGEPCSAVPGEQHCCERPCRTARAGLPAEQERSGEAGVSASQVTAMGDTSFLDYVLEQLSGAREIKVRAMFGGHGLYMGDAFFGIVHKGSLYFRTDEASRPDYVKRGSKPFNPKNAQELHRYYAVPADVLEDAEVLLEWAKRAVKTRD